MIVLCMMNLCLKKYARNIPNKDNNFIEVVLKIILQKLFEKTMHYNCTYCKSYAKKSFFIELLGETMHKSNVYRKSYDKNYLLKVVGKKSYA